MIDLGLMVTGLAVLAIFWRFRHGLFKNLLIWPMLGSWFSTSLVSVLGANMATIVFTMTCADFIIAGVALAIIIHDYCNMNARVVGAMSMALMPAHWFVSAMHGEVNWTMYASLVNVFFVLQCLVIGGWLDELGVRIHSLIGGIFNFDSLGNRH